MKIIVDAMGGDNAPQAPVMGAVEANREYGVGVILVGRGETQVKRLLVALDITLPVVQEAAEKGCQLVIDTTGFFP